MADDFCVQLYALIEGEACPHPKDFAAFKAKGDSAMLFGDLGREADAEFLFEQVINLVQSYGAPAPPKSGYNPENMNYYRAYRDFSVGELRQIVKDHDWPEDAWTWQRLSWYDKVVLGFSKFMLVGLLLVGVACWPLGFVLGKPDVTAAGLTTVTLLVISIVLWMLFCLIQPLVLAAWTGLARRQH